MDNSILETVLRTYEEDRAKLDWDRNQLEERIAGIRQLLGKRPVAIATKGQALRIAGKALREELAAPRKRRGMSAASRKAIAAAQRKRWANFRAAKAAPSTTVTRRPQRQAHRPGKLNGARRAAAASR